LKNGINNNVVISGLETTVMCLLVLTDPDDIQHYDVIEAFPVSSNTQQEYSKRMGIDSHKILIKGLPQCRKTFGFGRVSFPVLISAFVTDASIVLR